MAVNENVYGAANTWIDNNYQYPTITPKAKKANFGNNSAQLQSGVSQGKLSYDTPIDKSLSYCGLGTECALSHITYIATVGETPTVGDTQDRFVTNFAICEKYADANNPILYTTDIQRNQLNQFAWQPSQGNQNFNKYLEPWTKVIPQNQILYISVLAYDSNYNSWSGSLKEYADTYHTTYNRFACAIIHCYFGNKAQNITMQEYTSTGKRIPFQLSLLDEYKSTDFNLSFYSYGLTGMSFFGVMCGTGFMYKYQYFNMVALPDGRKEHIKIDNLNSTNYRIYIEYYDELIEDIKKSIACFGLYFTDDLSTAQNGTLTAANMYIGLLDNNGIGHGEYLKGADTANAPQNNYTDMSQSGYDYTKDVDKTKYRNDTQFYAGYGTSSFTKFYALTETQVNQLSQELYRIANDVPSGTSITEYNMKMFLTNNPIDCIISLKKFPVENIPLASSDATIYLGAKATNITGKILATPTWVYYFNFRNSADQSCRPIFGDNFLDYEPYTKCKIVIPFCGTVDVPVSYIYQYDDLQIALVMDFITGAVTAYILVNGITIDSITGSCAIDLPVSGIQSATLDSQIHSVAMAREKQQTTLGTGLIAGAVSIGIGLATGSLPVAIGGGAAIIGSFMHAEDTGKQINYELSHMETPVKQVSAASGQIAHTYDMRCKMIITRPTIADEYSAEEYANTIGYACLINTTVRELHGFTVGTINLDGIDATAQEKEMIQNAFASGVYLP